MRDDAPLDSRWLASTPTEMDEPDSGDSDREASPIQRLKSLPIPDSTPPSFFVGAGVVVLGGADARPAGIDFVPGGGLERRVPGFDCRSGDCLARRIS